MLLLCVSWHVCSHTRATGEPKVKLYRDVNGEIKGDGLCCYLKVMCMCDVIFEVYTLCVCVCVCVCV